MSAYFTHGQQVTHAAAVTNAAPDFHSRSEQAHFFGAKASAFRHLGLNAFALAKHRKQMLFGQLFPKEGEKGKQVGHSKLRML